VGSVIFRTAISPTTAGFNRCAYRALQNLTDFRILKLGATGGHFRARCGFGIGQVGRTQIWANLTLGYGVILRPRVEVVFRKSGGGDFSKTR